MSGAEVASAAADQLAGKEETETEDEFKERIRFQVELEFIQCLSNPRYLNYLAQRLTLEDESFLAYLDYLQYWKKPEYSKFILYPRKCFVFNRDSRYRTRSVEPNTFSPIPPIC